MPTTTDPAKPQRLELILREIDSLPTLPTIATRVLMLTSSEDSHIREVVDLISADPPLTAKILSLCRRADRGVRGSETLTVDKAVVLLGFTAVRNAVLSIKMFELYGPNASPYEQSGSEEPDRTEPRGQFRFDRTNFWRHSLAVAVASELIAAAHPQLPDLRPSEAFVCGLLHDVGKLALSYVLPRAFSRVVELAELHQTNIAALERRIMGLDHHTVGKRLAEQWQLPQVIQDCIWLHGAPFQTLPNVEHRRVIGLVGLADLVARYQHIGYSGNFTFKEKPEAVAEAMGLRPSTVQSITRELHGRLYEQSQLLGLDEEPSHELFFQSIQRANLALGRLNDMLEARTRAAADQTRILDAVNAFHAQTPPDGTLQDVFDALVASAQSVFGQGYYALLYQPLQGASDAKAPSGRQWLMCQYGQRGRPVRTQWVEPPVHSPELSGLDPEQAVSVRLMGVLPWLIDYLLDSQDIRNVQLLPLRCGLGTVALILHDRPTLPPWRQLQALTVTWASAIATAAKHDGAKRLSEELAESNRALAEAQDRLLHTQSMARLGEMAAGAAHEMNNPLAVISGRAQLLSMALPPGSKEHKAAQVIFEQSHRLSDLITLLRMFADPPQPQKKTTDLSALLDATVKRVQAGLARPEQAKAITLKIKDQLPPVMIDPTQISDAIAELLLNAIQSSPKSSVHVTVQRDESVPGVVVQVSDDGQGMDPHTLSHATDPFFSAQPAGRRVGMGLARVERFAAAHGGKLELRSTPGVGTVATLTIPLDS
jgi:signal transduction histidine kinase/HD-like signal output (HDOD) protein